MFNVEPAVGDDEIEAAARQYVRKISGFAKPSRANEAAFAEAVAAIGESSRRLLASLETAAAPRDRAAAAATAKERNARRFGTERRETA